MATTAPLALGEQSLALSSKEEVISTLRAQLQAFNTVWETSRRETGADGFTLAVGMYILQLTTRLDDLEAMDQLPIDILILHTFAKQHPALQPRTIEVPGLQSAPVQPSNRENEMNLHHDPQQGLDPYASLPSFPREHVLVNPNSGEVVSPRIAPNPAINLHPGWKPLGPAQRRSQGRT